MRLRSLISFLTGLALLLTAAAAMAQGTLIRLHTTQGPIDMRLLDTEAPVTVANFLAYVRGGDFSDVFVHRSAWSANAPFVVQAGGYRWTEPGGVQAVPSRGAIVNEFSASRSNLRGTVAMAKIATSPDSATSQWFINMSDNAANLDVQNGGFTVFARVTTPGMTQASAVASLPRYSAGAFTELPLVGFVSGNIFRSHVVRITEVTEFPASPSDNDRVFNYLEAAFPQHVSPSKGIPVSVAGFAVRYFSASNSYLGIKDGQVYFYAPGLSSVIYPIGTVADWLATAHAAGY